MPRDIEEFDDDLVDFLRPSPIRDAIAFLRERVPNAIRNPIAFVRRFVPKKLPAMSVALIVSMAGIVAAVLLFSQSLTPPIVNQQILTKNCDPIDPTPAGVLAGSSGFVYWGCGPSVGAFHVNYAGSATPTITKGPEWTTTYIFKTGPLPTTNCASAGGARAISSGTAVVFSTSDVSQWWYCSDYVNAPNPMSPITYSWDQAG